MNSIDNKIYKGKILNFNNNFGFITSELGDIYFHKSGLKSDFEPKKNDEIEFQIEDSPIKKGKIQAREIILLNRNNKENIPIAEEYRLGIVKCFNERKRFGFISTADSKDYYVHKSNLPANTFIYEGDCVVFVSHSLNGRLVATKCKPFITGLINLSSDSQSELLKEFAEKLDHRGYSSYNQIKSIVQSSNIDKYAKGNFLKSVFGKVSAEYQYRMLFEDCLIALAEETAESQTAILQKFGQLNIEQIKLIVQSDKITDTAKDSFIKSTFNKATIEYQFRMLIDGLISLSEEVQDEFLRKYLLHLGAINYAGYVQIKSIYHSNNIGQSAKDFFIKSAFENATAEDQFKMLFEDSLIDFAKETAENQTEILKKFGHLNSYQIKLVAESNAINKSTREVFIQSVFDQAGIQYQFQMLIDGLVSLSEDKLVEFLQKYLLQLGTINHSSYSHIKSIAQSQNIVSSVKEHSLKSAFENATADCQYKMLFEDCLIDISKETAASQTELLQKFGQLNIEQIKAIAQFKSIESYAKERFLKSTFEKTTADCKYRMLFKDRLINIKQESPESQTELLQKFGKLDIEQIKFIAKSNNIAKSSKERFLQSAFENTDISSQCEMLVDGIVFLSEKIQTELLQEYLQQFGTKYLITISLEKKRT